MKIEKRLEELKITLPPLGPPLGNYVPAKRVGNLLFLSGRGPGGRRRQGRRRRSRWTRPISTRAPWGSA